MARRKAQLPPVDALAVALADLEKAGVEVDAATLGRLTRILERRSELLGHRRLPLPWPTDTPEELLARIAPKYVRSEWAEEHRAIWRWAWQIEPGLQPRPLAVCLPRGRGKSTHAALVVIVLLALLRRRYALIVSGTQKQADRHLNETIQPILESREMAEAFPAMAERQLTKYGQSKGWTQQRLVCANGASIESVGLVESVRGLRHEEQRPDLILLDDADEWSDSADTILKKIAAITGAILPAGSTDAATLFVQNRPNATGLMSHVIDPRAFPEEEQFLLDRELIGPVPAIEGLNVEQAEQEDGSFRWRITGGQPTWPDGQPLEWCEREINKITLATFRRELQHDLTDPPGGIFSHLKFRHCEWDDVPWEDVLDIQVWVDPAVTSRDDSDCMAICAMGVDTAGKLYLLHSWEQRTTPEDAIRRAVLVAHDLGASTVGVETNQGGDLWEFTFGQVCEQLEAEVDSDGRPAIDRRPKFDEARASSGLSKAERAQRALSIEYEQGRIFHVRTGTEHVASKALYRFPKTAPHDWTDAHAWAVTKLRDLVPIRPLRADAFGPDADSAWKMPEAVPQPAVNGYSGSVWDDL